MEIENDNQFIVSKETLEEGEVLIEHQRAELEKLPLTSVEVDKAMQPILTFFAGIKEDIEFYEKKTKNNHDTQN